MIRNNTMGVVLALACILEPTFSASAQGSRRFAAAEWHQVGGIAPAVESPLLLPLLLAASGGLFVVFDYGDHAVKAFRLNGTLLWKLGRSGGGPREFANPTDLQADQDNRFWVLDPNNLRVTIIDSLGEVVRMVRLPRPVTRIIPLQGGLSVALDNSATFAFLLNEDGRVLDTVPRPGSLAEAAALALEARVTSAGQGRAGIITFLYGGALVEVSREGRVTRYVAGVEPIDLPKIVQWERAGALFTRLDPAAPYGALAVSSQGDDVYVVFAGKTRHAGGLVDIYGTEDLAYRGSLTTPRPCTSLAVPAPATFVCLVSQPVPAVYVWTVEY
jgi:hypothetical protein